MARRFALSLLAFSPCPLVLACPYCFTDLTSPQPRSAEAGVLVLIGFVVFVLGMIASLAFTWARRARALEKASQG